MDQWSMTMNRNSILVSKLLNKKQAFPVFILRCGFLGEMDWAKNICPFHRRPVSARPASRSK